MTVAVTGASGNLGRKTAELLLERLTPADVVLLTRTPDRVAGLRDRGATVRRADFDEYQSVLDALEGVERMLLISADQVGHRLGQHRAAIEAATTAGVAHIIYTSVPNPVKANPAGVAPDHQATEEAVVASGVAWTFLRNNLYAEYQIPTAARAIATGQLVTNAGDGRTAYVSRDDCAAAAAAVLVGTGHEGRAYDITGPEAISPADLAALASEIGGTGVAVVEVDDETLIAGLTSSGLPDTAAKLLASFGTSTREGFLERVSTAVEDLTGHPPRTLRDVLLTAREHLVAT